MLGNIFFPDHFTWVTVSWNVSPSFCSHTPPFSGHRVTSRRQTLNAGTHHFKKKVPKRFPAERRMRPSADPQSLKSEHQLTELFQAQKMLNAFFAQIFLRWHSEMPKNSFICILDITQDLLQIFLSKIVSYILSKWIKLDPEGSFGESNQVSDSVLLQARSRISFTQKSNFF